MQSHHSHPRLWSAVLVGIVSGALVFQSGPASAIGDETPLSSIEDAAPDRAQVELIPGVLPPETYVDESAVKQELQELGFPRISSTAFPGIEGLEPTTSVGTCVFCYSRSFQIRATGPRSQKRKVFVRHLSFAWSKASSYAWKQNTTVTATLNASIGPSASAVAATLGVAASRSRSWDLTTVIPANKKRYSKLSLRSDFQTTPVKARTMHKAALRPTRFGPWKSGTHFSPSAGGQYLTVTYQ